jgi:NAD(P)-dependent dehydrogenase (short-subunit alcohol dehydrogenase family)
LLVKSKNAYSIYISSSLSSLNQAEDSNSPSYKAGWVVYRQSKAALNMWAIEETKVLGELGVKTFAMCPGFVVSNLRGKSEEQRGGWGRASDPRVSGKTLLSIIQGKRDADVGKLVHKDGVYAW